MWRFGLVVAIGCSAPSGPLADAFDRAGDIDNLTSLSVTQHGAVVRAEAFSGTAAGTPHDVRSITKTVTALLVGIAIDRGCLASVDQPIGPLLGAQAPGDPAKAAITIKDLLTMSSGFQWSESGAIGDYNTWASAPDQVAFVLARPLVAAPGTAFDYDSGAFHLLSVILTTACGATADFASSTLFADLGIQTRAWELDAQGIANGAAGLQLTTAEMASIGELVLRGGIVPASYLAAATSAQIQTGDTADETPAYGYGIWLGDDAEPYLLGEGYGGQFLVIVPSKDLVVAATTNWQGLGTAASTTYYQVYDLIIDGIVPAF